jgi:hypothetical protein
MENKLSSTVDASSNLVERLEQLLQSASHSLDASAGKQVQEVQKKIDELDQKGLLKRQSFSGPSISDFYLLLL